MSATLSYVGMADAIEMIETGRWDTSLKELKEAIAAREGELLGAWREAIKPGFRVRVTDNVSPKWMAGLTGTIHSKAGKRLSVQLDYPHRMRNGRECRTLAAYPSHLLPYDG